MSYQSEYEKTTKGKYIRQRANANNRCIPWDFTFETWWDVWERSGKWELRGTHKDGYYMCRKNDMGPYSPDNVEIKSHSENVQESWDLRRGVKVPADPWVNPPRQDAWTYRHTCDWL